MIKESGIICDKTPTPNRAFAIFSLRTLGSLFKYSLDEMNDVPYVSGKVVCRCCLVVLTACTTVSCTC